MFRQYPETSALCIVSMDECSWIAGLQHLDGQSRRQTEGRRIERRSASYLKEFFMGLHCSRWEGMHDHAVVPVALSGPPASQKWCVQQWRVTLDLSPAKYFAFYDVNVVSLNRLNTCIYTRGIVIPHGTSCREHLKQKIMYIRYHMYFSLSNTCQHRSHTASVYTHQIEEVE